MQKGNKAPNGHTGDVDYEFTIKADKSDSEEDSPRDNDLPVPDIRINGSDEPLTIASHMQVCLTVGLDAGELTGLVSDWRVLAGTPFGHYSYSASKG